MTSSQLGSRHFSKTLLVIILAISLFTSSLPLVIVPAHAAITNGAIVAYRTSTGAGLTSPKIRFYDNAGGTYGSEIELSDTGSNIRDVRIKCSPTTAKCVVVSF